MGGVAGLAVPPFALLERGFYRSSAGVLLAVAGLYLAAETSLTVRLGSLSPGRVVTLGCWTAFTAALALYLASLWGSSGAWRARAYTTTLGLGLLGLAASAVGYRPGALLAPALLIRDFAFTSSSDF